MQEFILQVLSTFYLLLTGIGISYQTLYEDWYKSKWYIHKDWLNLLVAVSLLWAGMYQLDVLLNMFDFTIK